MFERTNLYLYTPGSAQEVYYLIILLPSNSRCILPFVNLFNEYAPLVFYPVNAVPVLALGFVSLLVPVEERGPFCCEELGW